MNPYTELPPRAFWRSAIANTPPGDVSDIWRPKFAIEKAEPIATLGSCFAQHISNALVGGGYTWLNAEPAPPKLPADLKSQFGFDIFSARVGNIYTVALLGQWTQWALGSASPPDEVWRSGDRFYDPFRPNIEPGGFASEEDVTATREQTIRSLRTMFETCKVFIFTLGLTEAWLNSAGGFLYPICPGVVAGEFAPERHIFKSYTYPEIYEDFCDIINSIGNSNPNIKIILTVSPVPLIATATNNHVLVATTQSKSILCTVASALEAKFSNVDYFPAYEIISSFPFKAMYYEANMRSVSKEGVAQVMRLFFEGLAGQRKLVGSVDENFELRQKDTIATASVASAAENECASVVCEEMMLDEIQKPSQ